MIQVPEIIKGGIHYDERGSIRFVNDFSFDEVKRFYLIKHPDTSTVRAWQGHRFEKKFFYPIKGSFLIVCVLIDNFDMPSRNLSYDSYTLSSNSSEILAVPNGYANGLLALEPDSEVMVLSNFSVEDSINEKYRYPKEWWFNWDNVIKEY